ncbi:M28 family metallopeptidase [Vitiosangium sp. GDMCC 1.1324]|uniref:M28 family metallopeptidase n=1 Tax=Vitiosangium sp. (strain GDMCC 1.1324) TaxID=2138576 RepID=UPI00130E80AA|nr:M28 family metallopeptidase [Vitiosangium sp. GDMCC 1.1324]
MDPTRPPSRDEALRPWLLGLGLVLAVVAIQGGASQTPRPLAADAPSSEFSEERAQRVMRHLAEDIGRRIPGTPAHREAATYLVGVLSELPRVEVELQEVEGVYLDDDTLIAYSTQNVVARLPGRRPDAVLLSAHYDSAPEGSGAADDALGIAAMVEVARALANEPELENSVIFNFNGAEEYGLLGAAGFMKHRWASQVRAFVNLEATGLGGRAILFQAGPDASWLLDAYARAVPDPFGDVLGQDLFQNHLIPADTDSHVYRTARIPGLDLALFQDGYAVHSPLDRPDRVEPGSLQHMGDSALAVTRELTSRPFPSEGASGPSIYYDVLGLWMIRYGLQGAWAWAAVAALLAAGATVLAARRRVIRLFVALEGLGFLVVSLVMALVLPVALAFLPYYVFNRPHGWYSSPWLAVAAFGGLSVTGALLPRALWARRLTSRGVPSQERMCSAWLAGIWLWVLTLGAMQLLGLGTAYLPLWWTVGGALGLIAASASASPRARLAALYGGWLPGLVLTVQLGRSLLELFIPVAGHLRLGVPLEPLVALLVALPVASASVLGLAPQQESARFGPSIAAFATVGVAFLVALILHFPYTPERPKRLWLEHRQQEGQSKLLFSSWDFPDPLAALSGQPEQLHATARMPGFRGGYEAPTPPAALPAPRLEVLESHYDETTALRTVRLRLESGKAYLVRLRIPKTTLAGWSLPAPLPPLDPDDTDYVLDVLPSSEGSRELTLLLKEREEVPVDVQAFFAEWPPPLEEARSRLPAWTTANLRVSTYTTLRL